METFREMLKVPSNALQAMVDGLRYHSSRDDFRIAMNTFGDTFHGVCFGCAATCTVQKATGKSFSPDRNITYSTVRAEVLGCEEYDLLDFEYVIDQARKGRLKSLFRYFEMSTKFDTVWNNRFDLHSDDWAEQLGAVEEVIAEMKGVGL